MIRIQLWNVQGSKENLQVLLETAKEEILLIQEPWVNPQAGGATYCPRGSQYRVIHEPKGRAAIYVRKTLEIQHWDYTQAYD
jgi:hypothetical protein